VEGVSGDVGLSKQAALSRVPVRRTNCLTGYLSAAMESADGGMTNDP
jgi:hypothetical protein